MVPCFRLWVNIRQCTSYCLDVGVILAQFIELLYRMHPSMYPYRSWSVPQVCVCYTGRVPGIDFYDIMTFYYKGSFSVSILYSI
jgi:hypothetical protein